MKREMKELNWDGKLLSKKNCHWRSSRFHWSNVGTFTRRSPSCLRET